MQLRILDISFQLWYAHKAEPENVQVHKKRSPEKNGFNLVVRPSGNPSFSLSLGFNLALIVQCYGSSGLASSRVQLQFWCYVYELMEIPTSMSSPRTTTLLLQHF